MSEYVQQTELDKAVDSPYLKMLKAAVPYVENPTKSRLAAFAKALELINTQKMLSGPEMLEACDLNKAPKDTLNMLKTMKGVGQGRDILLIDIMMNLFNVNNLIHEYNKFDTAKVLKNSSPENANNKKEHVRERQRQRERETHTASQKNHAPTMQEKVLEAAQTPNAPAIDNQTIDMLKSMLPPEQLQTFNMLSKMMANNSFK